MRVRSWRGMRILWRCRGVFVIVVGVLMIGVDDTLFVIICCFELSFNTFAIYSWMLYEQFDQNQTPTQYA